MRDDMSQVEHVTGWLSRKSRSLTHLDARAASSRIITSAPPLPLLFHSGMCVCVCVCPG